MVEFGNIGVPLDTSWGKYGEFSAAVSGNVLPDILPAPKTLPLDTSGTQAGFYKVEKGVELAFSKVDFAQRREQILEEAVKSKLEQQGMSAEEAKEKSKEIKSFNQLIK
jgi:putative cofactor-binding repeat protein